jgi:uncharacterized membrane protein
VQTGLGLLELASVAWFVVCWIGYTYFSRYRAKHRRRLVHQVSMPLPASSQSRRLIETKEAAVAPTSAVAQLSS